MTKLNIQPEQLKKIKELSTNDRIYQFLGYSLDLETGDFYDLLEKNVVLTEWGYQIVTALLVHYSLAKKTPICGKLVKFKDLPGGYAYEKAFVQRAIDPIAQAFGAHPGDLIEAAKLLGGKRLEYADLSVEIPALEGIPIVYILWAAEEFSSSANVLFDESANCFLDTEALAVLGELATHRLLKAQLILKEKRQ